MPQRGAKNKHEADKLNTKVLLKNSCGGLSFSSPSACRKSRVSKNQDWPDEIKAIDLVTLALLGVGSLRCLYMPWDLLMFLILEVYLGYTQWILSGYSVDTWGILSVYSGYTRGLPGVYLVYTQVILEVYLGYTQGTVISHCMTYLQWLWLQRWRAELSKSRKDHHEWGVGCHLIWAGVIIGTQPHRTCLHVKVMIGRGPWELRKPPGFNTTLAPRRRRIHELS